MSDTKMQYLSSIGGDIMNLFNSKADANLISNINNTSDLLKPISTATQNLLNLKQDTLSNYLNLAYVDISSSLNTLLSNKANRISPNLTGVPIAPTATAANNSNQIATTAYVDNAVSSVVPVILDNSLTIAQTNNLQTTLNAKMPFLFPVIRVGSGATQTAAFSLDSSHYNKMVSWITSAAITITIPSPVGVPDGTWMGLNAVSSVATVYAQNIVVVSGQNTIGQMNATSATTSSGGSSHLLICIGGAWRCMS